MQFAFSVKKYHKHTSLDLFIKQINEHAKNVNYAIARKQNKSLKFKIFIKIIFRCDRDDK